MTFLVGRRPVSLLQPVDALEGPDEALYGIGSRRRSRPVILGGRREGLLGVDVAHAIGVLGLVEHVSVGLDGLYVTRPALFEVGLLILNGLCHILGDCLNCQVFTEGRVLVIHATL